jgi:hypothetical protein
MGRVVWLGLYLIMTVGGVLALLLHLLYAPANSFKFVVVSTALAAAGASLIWADFLR